MATRTLLPICCLFYGNLFALFLGRTSAGAETEAKYFRSDGGVFVNASRLPGNLEDPDVLRWRVDLDPGHSTPLPVGGRIFLTAYHAESQELMTLALDSESGRKLWARGITVPKVEQTHPIGSPATATPATDGKRLFVFFGSCGLFCYDFEGQKLWEQRLGPFQDEYGAGSSPVVVDNKVILNQDHDIDSFLAAYDSNTGRLLWRVRRPDAVRSYSTPCVWNRKSGKELLVAGALDLSAYDLDNGTRLWGIPGLARIVIPIPVPAGDVIYMASWAPGGDSGKRLALDPWPKAVSRWDANGDGRLAKNEVRDAEVLDRFFRMDLDQNDVLDEKEWERHASVFTRAQNAVLAVKPAGRGELGEEAVLWKYQRGVPYVATPLVDRGILWMVKDGGIVTKLDAGTGKLLQEERLPGYGSYYASPVSGDGKVYFAGEQGVVSVVANQPEWQLLSSRQFNEKIYATPVPDRERLYIRTEKALYSFGHR